MHRLVRATLAGGAATVAVALSASPAFAGENTRSLPTNSALYSISCDGRGPLAPLQLLKVDAADAVSTPVGAGTPELDTTCAGQGAMNPVTRDSYFLGWGDENYLAKVDLSTGVSTKVGDFIDQDGRHMYLDAMAIDLAGHAYVFGKTARQLESEAPLPEEDLAYGFYSVDLATAAATRISTPVFQSSGMLSFAVDPVDGKLYALDKLGVAYAVDPTTGALTKLEALDLGGNSSPSSMVIDTNGVAWLQNDGDVGLWSVPVVDFTDGVAGADVQSHGVFTIVQPDRSSYEYYHESLILDYTVGAAEQPVVVEPAAEEEAKALAETGVDDSAISIAGSVAAAVLAAGAGLLVLARGRRRAV